MSVLGRWDLTIIRPDESTYASWVELREEGGFFVGMWGSARPIASVQVQGDEVTWQLPRQYEPREDDLRFHGKLVDGKLIGSTILDNGDVGRWVGEPAPAMERTGTPTYSDPIELIGSDLSNWTNRGNGGDSWKIEDGILVNSTHGTDLVSNETFDDFRLVAEYRYPEGSNSGIYLRGRYEYQILDDHGHEPTVGHSGAIYGWLTPRVNAIKPFGEWNTAEITLLGRRVTVVLNGETVIDEGEIPGITGDALESNEGAPGPIMLQGTHGPVHFGRLSIQRVSWS